MPTDRETLPHTRHNRPPWRSRRSDRSRGKGQPSPRPCGGSCGVPVPPTDRGGVPFGSGDGSGTGDRRNRSRQPCAVRIGSATVRHTRHNRPPWRSRRSDGSRQGENRPAPLWRFLCRPMWQRIGATGDGIGSGGDRAATVRGSDGSGRDRIGERSRRADNSPAANVGNRADGHAPQFSPLYSHRIIKTPIKQGRQPCAVAFSGIFTRRNRPPTGSDRIGRRSRRRQGDRDRRQPFAVRTGHGKGQPSRVPCLVPVPSPVAFGSGNPPTDRGDRFGRGNRSG